MIDEVTEVQKIFKQMEMAVEQHCAEKTDTVSSSKSALTFAELFETNELKAQIQVKDTVILKLKEKTKSSSGDVKERKVTKLTAENNHLKQTYKQLFDSIKSSRVQSKE
nr:hypothetical protein [Tanacetum cinerariifolium]